MKLQIIAITLFCILLLGNCCEEVTGPIPDRHEWMPVPEFVGLEIRFTYQHNGALYIAARDPAKDYPDENTGFIFKTTDGENWEKIGSFPYVVGPMTARDDTLYIIGGRENHDNYIYAYTEGIGWWQKYVRPIWVFDAIESNDMIFYNGYLYVMQGWGYRQTFRFNPDGSYVEIYPYAGSNSGMKFAKIIKDNNEILYIRPIFGSNLYNIMLFENEIFIPIYEGLEEKQRYGLQNSFAVRNDTLFTGVKNPSSIYVLVNNIFYPYTDSMPYSINANLFSPPLKTVPLCIALGKDKLYVGTVPVGVLEWSKEQGWKKISDGLFKLGTGEYEKIEDLYQPVIFLEFINNRLFAGYGEPPYSQYGCPVKGLFKKIIN